MIKPFIFIAVLMSLLSGCKKEIITDQALKDGINFSIKEVATKGEVITDANLKSMGVFCYTGEAEYNEASSTPNYIFKQKFVRENTSIPHDWTAVGEAPLWDREKNYHSFIAFAPYDAITMPSTYNDETAGHPQIRYTVLQDAADHRDLLWASKLNTMNYYIGSKPVELSFNHALTKISATVAMKRVLKNDEKVEFTMLGFVNVNDAGDMKLKYNDTEKEYTSVEWIVDPNFKLALYEFTAPHSHGDHHIEGEIFAAVFDKSSGTDAKTILGTKGAEQKNVFMLPQSFNLPDEGEDFNLNEHTTIGILYRHTKYVLVNDNPVLTTIEKTIAYPIPAKIWNPGMGMNYKITFDPDEGAPSMSIVAEETHWNDQPIDENLQGGTFELEKRLYTSGDVKTGTVSPYREIEIPFITTYQKKEMITITSANATLNWDGDGKGKGTINYNETSGTKGTIQLELGGTKKRKLSIGIDLTK